jgi:hypothetical protein
MPEKYGVDDPVPRTYWQQFVYPFTSGHARSAEGEKQTPVPVTAPEDVSIEPPAK